MSRSLLLLLILLSLRTTAQEPVFRNLSPTDGLPSSEAYMVMEDQKGYIWVATDRGVARYDGYDFEVFGTDHGWGDNTVTVIQGDDQGRIWACGQNQTLTIYDGRTTQVRFFGGLRRRNFPVISLHIDPDGTAWMGHKGAMESKAVTKSPAVGPATLETIREHESRYWLHQWPDGNWTHGYLSYGKGKDQALEVVDNAGNSQTLHSPGPGGFFNQLSHGPSATGGRLIVFRTHLYEWNNGTIRHLTAFGHETLLGVLEDHQGNIWIPLEEGGVLVFSNRNFDQPQIWLKDHTITHIIQDREGGIWLSSLDAGLFYTPATAPKSMTRDELVGKEKITSFGFVDSLLCVSTQTGVIASLNLLSPQPWKINRRGLGVRKGGLVPASYGRAIVTGFEEENSTSRFFDPQTLSPIKDIPGWTLAQWQRNDTMFYLSNRSIWTEHGGFGPKIIEEFIRWNGSYFRQDTVWLGASNGWYYLAKDQIHPVVHNIPELKGRINAIDGRGGTLVMATAGKGVVLVTGGKSRLIKEQEGLSNNYCNDLVIDEEGTIWVATLRGLDRIDGAFEAGKTIRVRHFDEATGLVSNEVHQVEVINKTYLVRTPLGVSYFPRDLNSTFLPPPVYIEGVKVNDEVIPPDEKLALTHRENNLQIDFRGLTYRSPSGPQYRYRLSGSGQDWQVTRQNRVDFPGLSPGNYRFEVVAVAGEGIASELPAVLEIEIFPPWWQTLWFWLGLGLLVLLVGIGIARYRERQLRQTAQLRQAYLESELKALKAQITPHFVFNSLNSIMGLLYQKQVDKALKGLGDFSRLMRQILTQSSVDYITVEEEISTLKSYLALEQMRHDQRFEVEVSVVGDLEPTNLTIPPMVIQPYVENAIKHGVSALLDRKGRISLQFEAKGKELIVSIIDNGIGRKKAEERKGIEVKTHKSMGMQITRGRIKALSDASGESIRLSISDLTDENGVAAGTHVELRFPLRTLWD